MDFFWADTMGCLFSIQYLLSTGVGENRDKFKVKVSKLTMAGLSCWLLTVLQEQANLKQTISKPVAVERNECSHT